MRSHRGFLDARYAVIAMMSASSSFATTRFMSGVSAPFRVPALMS